MIVWRLCKKKHSAGPIDGEGARRYGGRWNHPGTPLAYCAASLSLAVLEMLAHVDPSALHSDLIAVRIDIPDDIWMKTMAARDLPKGWRAPTGCDALKDLGVA
jgi:RES domain-containing protein